MQQFVDAMRAAVADHNSYAALALALTLPDIAGALAMPGTGSKKRYIAWWNEYLTPVYSWSPGHPMLGGADAYALRCAVLHQGVDDVRSQDVAQTVERFSFVETDGVIHRNQNRGVLNLQVSLFCEDIGAAVERFMSDRGVAVGEAAQSLMTITDMRTGAAYRM